MNIPNLEYIKQLANGDLEFEKTLISILKKEFPEEKKRYEQLLKTQEFKETAAIVHKIKHKINILGLKDAVTLAANYEKELNQKKCSLQKEFNDVLSKITIFLDKI